jgi:PAS domain S-box-containing protein
MLVWDGSGSICLTNAEARRMLGYDDHEMTGLSVASLLPEAHHGPLQGVLAWFGPEPGSMPTDAGPEFRMRRKDGAETWVQLGINPVRIDGATHVVGVMINIDRRRRAEAALRESEEKFAKAFRASPEAMSVHELASGRYVDVNEGFLRLFGYASEEILGRTPLELDLWADAADRLAFVRSLSRDGKVHRFAARIRVRSGEIRDCELSAETIEISGRLHNVTVLHDVTARRRAEAALRESEEKFAKAFRASPDPIAITDLETGRYIDANGGHEEVFGFTREEVIGRTTTELGYYRNPDDRLKLVAAIRAHGHVRNLELACFNRRREPITVLLSAEAIEMHGRRCLVSVVHNVTARYQAEQGLRDSEEKFAKAFRGSPYSLTISELETGLILDVNEGFEKLSGYSRAEVLGQTAVEFGFWTNPADRAELVRRLQNNIEVRNVEREFPARNGRRVVARCSCQAIEVGGKACLLIVLEDITAQRAAELEKAALKSQLKQSQKLEALGTLAGGIAHDFNNILSAMIVYRELAVMDIDQPDALRQHLAEIGHASNRAKELVRQILTFSRQQHQERQPGRLHAVVREALQLLRASLPATIEIVPVIDEQAPEVLADVSQIHQIVMNLGTNAGHAMRDRPGRLEISLGRCEVSSAQAARHPALRPGSYVRLSVADTGHGMDEEVVARIFEPFFTTKGPGEGTGLGLSVVHGIMVDHEGAVLVRSRPGMGTTFDLYFPVHTGATAFLLEKDGSTPRGNGETLLLIDDEKPLCDAMREGLTRLGYRVEAFTEPLAALSRFRATPFAFDLLVTDHTMPHLTGLDVIEAVHRVRPEMPVTLVSGLSGTWTAEKLRGFDIRELVAKPVNFSSLAQAVRRTLDRGGGPVR